MVNKRNLDIGFATFGEEIIVPRGTTIGLDPEANPELIEQDPNIIQVRGIAEQLPFRSNSLNRVTSTFTIGDFSEIEESLEQVVRVLSPGGTANITLSLFDQVNQQNIRRILRDLPVANIRIIKLDEIESEVTVRITFRKI